jgi:superfamily II DNA/RNA helicase
MESINESSTTIPTTFTFKDLGIEPFLIKSLAVMSIKIPTQVQSACIPPVLAGADCISSAQTGSGKTIAFAIPILQALSKDPYGLFALVLTPTRYLISSLSIHQFDYTHIRTTATESWHFKSQNNFEYSERP